MSDPLEQLCGLAEIARICQVSKTTALRYTRREDFPTPLGRISAGPVWRCSDITRWATTTLPLPVGRPTRPDPPQRAG